MKALWACLLALCCGLAWAQSPAQPALPEEQQVLVLLQLPPAHFRPDSGYGGAYGDAASRSARKRVARELASAHGLQLVADWPMPLLGVDCYVMNVPSGSAARMAEQLSADARVAWAQPMNLYRAQGHGDPLFAVQPAAQAWRLDELHQVATGHNVKVAVVDSGVDDQHPDLAGQVVARENFIERRPWHAEQHGTAVAGVIAARADNGVGIVGIAPQARLVALRACWQQAADASLCSTLSLAQALHYAIANDAQVINLSLAGPDDRLLGELIDLALARGISVVGAADPQLAQGGFPASHAGVIGVVAQGSQPPPAGLLAAPGQDVPTTTPGGRWMLLSGSSFAAAHVSGLLALVHELQATAHPVRTSLVPGPRGTVDACATLRVMNACACGCGWLRAETSAARP